MPSDLTHTRSFFAAKAAEWDAKVPDDGPVYAAAVADLEPPVGGVVLDAGCGTARAAGSLREAVGPDGLVLGADATPEMLAAATAAGLIPHVPDPVEALAELARVTRPGGRLALFHPISRAALAARHGTVPQPTDTMDPANLRPALEASGWAVDSIDDADRYLALAHRPG
jgi:SAM-dependent methyltransferase